MANYGWSRFVTRINIKAPIEKLYLCWATLEGMEYWFLRLSEFKTPDGNLRAFDDFVQEGDGYRWHWHGCSDETTEAGTILAANGTDYLKFSFEKADSFHAYTDEGTEAGKKTSGTNACNHEIQYKEILRDTGPNTCYFQNT
jgi:uncharacterized protein YndB with AHSA1/START domain